PHRLSRRRCARAVGEPPEARRPARGEPRLPRPRLQRDTARDHRPRAAHQPLSPLRRRGRLRRAAHRQAAPPSHARGALTPSLDRVHTDERKDIVQLLLAHGWNATSFQLLEPGYLYYRTPVGAVAYRDTGKTWVAA